jgi:2-polyprenyl-3-methyl-5-hydroxy-6-metoxy-1,4-benzoquinol methylase
MGQAGSMGDGVEIGARLDETHALEQSAPHEAFELWAAFDAARGDLGARRGIARFLRDCPRAPAERKSDLQRLLTDSEIDPDDISSAGWNLLLGDGTIAPQGEPEPMAAALEADPLALMLLSECTVFVLDAELALTAVRRWLLLSGRWQDYPRLRGGLRAQARRNGGAWPFDADERTALERTPVMAAAYVRSRIPGAAGGRFADGDIQAMADNYVRWPYPEWSRVTAPEPTTVPAAVEKLDDGRPSDLPVKAEILVAGCGTGREAALLAKRFPEARVTAIDLSETALAYAAEHCAGLGIEFRMLDLHDAANLEKRFHLIACSGVLHHLPNPEAGWAKLASVLSPRGVMKIMVYSRIARLRVAAAKAHIADLLAKTIDDDLLREIRRRLIKSAPPFVTDFRDFYSLTGVHDLLLNPHEDTFDVPRIVRGLDRTGLELLAFRLPTKADEARYRRDHPGDPLLRDVQAWGRLEKTQPLLFSSMYEFWCRATKR